MINPKYKDQLFCTVFGKEKYKRYALSLYNAVNKSHYTDPSELEIITLENVVYLGMKNDAAYLLAGDVSLYEHQSTVNPNMPLRGFMYMGELYGKILGTGIRNRRLYSSKLIKIPTPQYYVFYNGTEDFPEVEKYKLSDAFINPRDDGEFEFTATVYNINLGKNKDLLDSCEPLKGYSTFVYRVRKNEKTMPPEEAIKAAMESCIDDGILKDVLSDEKEAVMNSVLYGFTAKEEREYQKMMLREAREEGLAEGLEQGLEQGHAEERQNTEAERRKAESERRRADTAEAELAKYKAKFGEIKE